MTMRPWLEVYKLKCKEGIESLRAIATDRRASHRKGADTNRMPTNLGGEAVAGGSPPMISMRESRS